jgi:hypothetical protein
VNATLAIRLGGEAVRVRVEGDPRLCTWLRKAYAAKATSGRADLVVRRGGIRGRDGRLHRAIRPHTRRAMAEWAVANEALRRLRARAPILHAAWVALGRDSVLIVGRHASGKTTLALAMELLRGWRVVVDDVVVLADVVRPVERPLSLKPGTPRALPAVRRLRVDGRPWAKGWPVLVPRRHRGALPRVRAIAVLAGRPGGALRAETLSEGMAVAQIARHLWNLTQRPGEALSAAARIARGARIVRLRGGGIDARCDAVESLMR